MKSRILSAGRLAFPLATALAALLAATSANATNLYWDTNGTGTAGSGAATGTWGSSAFWSTDSTGANIGSPVLTAATTNADDLFFAAGTNGTAGTVTVNGTQSAHSITFDEGAITLSGGTINLGSATAGSGLSFNNVVGYNMNTPIILNSAATNITLKNAGNQGVTYGATGTITGSSSGLQTITIGGPGSGGGPSTFNGIISNGGGGNTVALTVDATSTTTLAAANAYTGATNIIRGTLSIGNASTFSNTSVINLTSNARLDVNAADSTLAKLATAGGGSGVIEGSFLRYSKAQTAAGAGNGPGTIFGTVELNLTNVNPNYTLDFGARGALTNVLAGAVTYTSPLTLSGTASIDASQANAANTATYSTGGITASTVGAKTLNLTGLNTGANTISGAIGDGSGTIGVTKGGGGTWVLSGTNTYTGSTRVDGGILQFAKTASLYNSTTGSWTAANIRVGNGGTLALNVGGTDQFTTGNVTTLLGNLGGANGTSTTGFAAGSAIGFDTTNASGNTFTVADVLADSTGTGGGAIGLNKLGTNTLVLSNDNTYTGRTVISGGTLQLGAGGTTGKLSNSSSILNNGTLTINRSDAVAQGTDFSGAPINGTGAFINAGAGTTTLNAANTFSGSTTVTAGTLALTNSLALQNSALNTTGAGFVTLSSATPTFGGLSNSGTTRNLATVINSGYGSVTNLTLNTVGAGSFTYGGIIGEGATGMTLTKTGTGTQILSGANAYTGDTIVNGGVLTVGSGANGSISSSSGLQMGGGTFNYSRTGAGQTVDGLTVNAGNSTVNNTSSGQTLTLGAITRTGSVYGTVNFATLTGSINTSTANTNGILGPWATTGSTTTLRYALGGGNISGLTGTAATANTLANVTDATGNFEYSAAVAGMGAGLSLTANTLRYSGAATTTAINATSTLTLNGLMNAGSGALSISGGPTTGGIVIGSTNELVVAANAQATTISSVIKDGGSAGRLIYSGGGALTLSGLNTFSGGLVINSGIVNTAAAASLSSGGTGTGAITVQGAGTLELNSGVGTLDRALTLNGGRLYFNGSGGNLTVAGTIAFGANSTIEAPNTNSGFPIITANTSGTGGFTKTNIGGLRLNGTSNNYDGPTVVSAGGLTVKSSLYGNVTSKWTPANITVASGATLMLNVEGAGEFTIANAATMFSQLSTNVNNNGLLAGSIVGVDTRNAAVGTYTYSSVITDSTGAGGGAVSFKHTGGGNATILELTGANTYSGTTIVDNDSTLKVSSLNSVFTNSALGTVHSASSSLGAPTTVANGIIHLGTAPVSNIGSTFRGGSLTYTGTGETTDRIISLNGGGGISDFYRFDQSGTGHLKFLSSFVMGDGRATKVITLQGSTAGTGEIAGQIPDAGVTNLTKSGTGTWTLSGANLYAGVTTVSGGALVLANANALKGGIGATGGNGALTFNGGVIGLDTDNNTFSRPLAAAGTAGAVTFTGAGGWAAYNADRTVNLGGASASVTWATASTGLNGQTLILGNATSTHTVDFQNPLDLGNAARTVQVDNGSAAIDGKLSGILSGVGGGLTKTGLGTLVLTNTNSYTGATAVQAGTLSVGSLNSVVGGTANSNIGAPTTVANGTIAMGSTTNAAQLTYTGTGETTDRVLNLAGTTGGATIDQSGASGTLKFTSSLTATGAGIKTLTLQGSTAGKGELSGAIVDNSGTNKTSLSKSGTGTWTLSGTNTYTGTTVVNAGTLQFAKQTSLYNNTDASWTAANINVKSAATLALNVDSAGSAGFTATKLNTLLGNISVANTAAQGLQAGATLAFDTSTASGGTFTQGNAIANSTGANGGAVGLTKLGAGTLVLDKVNTYTGATTVSAGTLIINGSTSSTSLVTVNSGAALGGSGTVGGNTSIAGNHNPGNSPGIQTFSGNLAYTGGSSVVNWELIANTVGINPNPNANFDQIIVGGNLDFTDLTTLNLAFNASGSGVVWSNMFWDTDQSWTLYDVAGTTTNFANLSLNTIDWLDSGSNAFNSVRSGNTFTLTQTGNDIVLNYNVVPEPRAALLGGLGLLALLRRRRQS